MEAPDIAAYLMFKKSAKERKIIMSSVATQADKGLFSTFPASHHIYSEDETTQPAEESVEKPAEENSSQQSSGSYKPNRASWHTATGKIKNFLA